MKSDIFLSNVSQHSKNKEIMWR